MAKGIIPPPGFQLLQDVNESFLPDLLLKAIKGFDNYLEWKAGTKLELITMEVPLISEIYQYGTTVDIVAAINGRTCLVEAKTSNAIHEDFLIQLAAQKHAWDENHPDQKIDGVHILKVNKENAAFVHAYFGELPGCLESFLCLRELYDRKKQLKGLM